MNQKFVVVGLIILALFAAGCPSTPITPPAPGPGVPPVVEPEQPDIPVTPADDSGATPEGVEAVVNGNSQFAFDLYLEYKSDSGNIFFSPYSISTALAMTYEGARGKTAEEMLAVFHFPENASVRQPAFASIYNQLNRPGKPYKLSTANALWAEQTYTFLDEYLTLVEKRYGGKTTNLDFINQADNSRKTINDWVAQQTNDKIKDIIPPGSITPDTRLVLTNAIYFKGNWALKFDKTDTKDEDFRLSPGNTVKVPMMSQTSEKANFGYYSNSDLQIIELPYENFNLSMFVLLPKNDNLAAAEDALNPESFSDLKNRMYVQRVNVFMPKFKFETKYFMVETLKNMGMHAAFSPVNADFSGMDGSKNLSISDVIHQAFVEVNEEGTEAAAATVVVITVGISVEPDEPPQPKIFRADHPFVFIITEKETGSILFMGRVNDPRG